MKTIIFTSLILIISTVAQAIPSRINNGKVEFAIATVDGFPAYSQQQINDLEAEKGVQAISVTPATYEINLSTCLMVVIDGEVESGFANYSEWISCQTKAGLKRKVRKIRQLIDSMSDLPAADSKDLRERAGWLKSYYLSLP